MGKTQVFGKKGEEEAEKYLINLGYKILNKNFRSRLGEIDIIAQDKDTLVFVEVKTRSSVLWGQPAESIRRKKLNSIIKTSQYYLLLNKRTQASYRIDAIEVYFSEGRFGINHIKNITL